MASILIIDDNASMRLFLRTILEASGHKVAEAEDGHAGLDFYRVRPADVILLDMVMPEKDGIETLRELLAEFPAAVVIAMSGVLSGSALDPLLIARVVGARDVLHKPFSIGDLQDAVIGVMARL
jgi:two-component system chemotaxis response regulator CheY